MLSMSIFFADLEKPLLAFGPSGTASAENGIGNSSRYRILKHLEFHLFCPKLAESVIPDCNRAHNLSD